MPELEDYSDEFINGNTIEYFFEYTDEEDDKREFTEGDIVHFELYGTSKGYYNFIKILIEQSVDTGNPFSTTPAPLRGNCVNLTTPDNYAFGYFRLSQVVKATYTFQ